MDPQIFEDALTGFKNRRPFHPFTIALVNGDRYEIDSPDGLAYRGGLAVFVGPGRVPVFFDSGSVSQVIGDLASEIGSAGS